tara:strand:+ start:835 stop:1266 length:432 start_codon:yes stop_codon:yes gene_type:complete
MMRRERSNDEAQMLLATGVVLILALLSMAIYSVKVVGMGEPYNASDDAVLQTAEETSEVWQTSIQHRFDDLNGIGTVEERCLDAANSVKADLMRHGEHRGVEIILVDLNATIDSDICTVVAEAGIADRNGRLLIDLHAEIDVS